MHKHITHIQTYTVCTALCRADDFMAVDIGICYLYFGVNLSNDFLEIDFIRNEINSNRIKQPRSSQFENRFIDLFLKRKYQSSSDGAIKCWRPPVVCEIENVWFAFLPISPGGDRMHYLLSHFFRHVPLATIQRFISFSQFIHFVFEPIHLSLTLTHSAHASTITIFMVKINILSGGLCWLNESSE